MLCQTVLNTFFRKMRLEFEPREGRKAQIRYVKQSSVLWRFMVWKRSVWVYSWWRWKHSRVGLKGKRLICNCNLTKQCLYRSFCLPFRCWITSHFHGIFKILSQSNLSFAAYALPWSNKSCYAGGEIAILHFSIAVLLCPYCPDLAESYMANLYKKPQLILKHSFLEVDAVLASVRKYEFLITLGYALANISHQV